MAKIATTKIECALKRLEDELALLNVNDMNT
mgnify:CR=1 FL=1